MLRTCKTDTTNAHVASSGAQIIHYLLIILICFYLLFYAVYVQYMMERYRVDKQCDSTPQ